MRLSVLLTAALIVGLVPDAYAIDHKNLDEGRPLRLEDAYPIASGELAVEAGAGFTVQRRSADRGVFPVEILYGAYPNLQLGLGTTLSTDPHEIDDQSKSGDLRFSGLYNFNQETLTRPALGAKLTLNLPTGVDSSGIDVEVKALATKSFDRLSVHLNAAYEFLSGTRPQSKTVTSSRKGSDFNVRDERNGRYEVSVGASYPIGAPRYTRTTLVADVFTEQGRERGASNSVGAEIGFRHQLTSRVVLDAGVGSEFVGPADRSAFFFTAGISVGF